MSLVSAWFIFVGITCAGMWQYVAIYFWHIALVGIICAGMWQYVAISVYVCRFLGKYKEHVIPTKQHVTFDIWPLLTYCTRRYHMRRYVAVCGNICLRMQISWEIQRACDTYEATCHFWHMATFDIIPHVSLCLRMQISWEIQRAPFFFCTCRTCIVGVWYSFIGKK